VTAPDPLALASRVAQHLRGDEIVVLKASRGVALERILPALKARAKHVDSPGAPLHPR
jgi:UDP-N-acetylmuramyl pentapeptide synthase